MTPRMARSSRPSGFWKRITTFLPSATARAALRGLGLVSAASETGCPPPNPERPVTKPSANCPNWPGGMPGRERDIGGQAPQHAIVVADPYLEAGALDGARGVARARQLRSVLPRQREQVVRHAPHVDRRGEVGGLDPVDRLGSRRLDVADPGLRVERKCKALGLGAGAARDGLDQRAPRLVGHAPAGVLPGEEGLVAERHEAALGPLPIRGELEIDLERGYVVRGSALEGAGEVEAQP